MGAQLREDCQEAEKQLQALEGGPMENGAGRGGKNSLQRMETVLLVTTDSVLHRKACCMEKRHLPVHVCATDVKMEYLRCVALALLPTGRALYTMVLD